MIWSLGFFLLSFFCYHILVIIFREINNRIRLLHPIAEGSSHICQPKAKMQHINITRAGSEVQYGPRSVGEILTKLLQGDSLLAKGYRRFLASKEIGAEKGGTL